MLLAGVLLFGGIGGGNVITVNSIGRLVMQLSDMPVLINSISGGKVLSMTLVQTPVLAMELRSD
jgi:hypothetical protein